MTVRRAVSAVAVLALVLTAALVAALDLSGRLPGGLVADRPTASPSPLAVDPRPSAAGAVLPSGAPATPSVDQDLIYGLLADPALGGGAAAVVVDVATGTDLYVRDADAARTPASVLKLATGAAALQVLPADRRFDTRVVRGDEPDSIVLVGGGDATLRRSTGSDGRASLEQLAVATADVLAAEGRTSVRIAVDDSLFTGPAVSPHWRPSYVPSGAVRPVSALSVTGVDQTGDPALDAGRVFGARLARLGVTVAGEVLRGPAPADADLLATVPSPTVADLVERMLRTSDNDLAESLSRLVAVEGGRPGTFDDGTASVGAALRELGVPIEEARLLDGSGLARGSRLTPRAVAALLTLAGDGTAPHLGPLVSGLPVASYSGTLLDRFGDRREPTSAGVVRAKTGTLTGVSALAGYTSAGGRALAFVVMTDQVPGSTLDARAALDRVAAALTSP